MEADHPRGSEWRKWDLHVHTPYSVLHSEFGDDFDRYARTPQELAADRGALVNLDEQLRLLRNEDASLSRRQVAGERLIERLRTLETTLARRLEEMEPDASVLDLELADLVTVRVDLGPLDFAMEETRARRADIADLLDGGNAEGPASQRASAATQVRDLEDQLSLPEGSIERALVGMRSGSPPEPRSSEITALRGLRSTLGPN